MLRMIGKIYTGLMSPVTVDCAVVGDDGKILATGDAARAFRGARVEETALGNRVACPGFIDAHVHLDDLARELTQLNLGDAKSLEDVLARVADAAKKTPPDRALIGGGWDESMWPVQAGPACRLPTREKLDRAAPDRAVILRRVCGHLWAVNSETLRRVAARADLTPHERERLAAVSADGLLREDDVALAAPFATPSPAERIEGLRAAMRHARTLGVTAVCDMSNAGEALVAIERGGTLPIRVVAATSTGLSAPGSTHRGVTGGRRVHPGPVKMFLDGSIGAQTAAVSTEFADDPGNCGVLLFETSALVAKLVPHHEAGRDLALHAIGDRAIAQALDAFDALGPATGRRRIEHLEIITPELTQRMARLGVIASMQPNFIGRWQMPGGLYEHRFGWPRARGLNPCGSILRAGASLAFGSDCMPMGPLFGIRSAMNHPLPAERLTFPQALHAYTLSAAQAGGIDALAGSIQPGKDADLVILSADPAKLSEVAVEKVYVAGKQP